jgi:uncharacterized repeat protein (TIGR03809 family)
MSHAACGNLRAIRSTPACIESNPVDFCLSFPQDISRALTDSFQLRVRPSFFMRADFMTHQLDVAGGRDVIARWCALAEQRLEYLAELFETGRWRGFHSEHALLENIEEAKAAVRTWRELSSREATSDNRPIDKSWLDRTSAAVTLRKTWRDPAQLPWPAKIPAEMLETHAEKPPWRLPDNSSVHATAGLRSVPSGETSPDKVTLPVLDLATIARRYPLLRNRY